MRKSSPGWLRVLVLSLLVAGLALSACTTSRRTDMDASSVDMGMEAGPIDVADNDATGTTCQGIRICVAAGQSLDVCVARGTPAAQDTFNKLLGCLKQQPLPGCTGTDPACLCPEECYADGLCLDETAACLDTSGAATDGVCDQYCSP